MSFNGFNSSWMADPIAEVDVFSVRCFFESTFFYYFNIRRYFRSTFFLFDVLSQSTFIYLRPFVPVGVLSYSEFFFGVLSVNVFSRRSFFTSAFCRWICSMVYPSAPFLRLILPLLPLAHVHILESLQYFLTFHFPFSFHHPPPQMTDQYSWIYSPDSLAPVARISTFYFP
jgi:hypothetical protein